MNLLGGLNNILAAGAGGAVFFFGWLYLMLAWVTDGATNFLF